MAKRNSDDPMHARLRSTRVCTVFGLAFIAATSAAHAQTPGGTATGSAMTRLGGVWVEGPGYDITYGGSYGACAARCLAAPKCLMIEYYRPEKKCNLYDAKRPVLKGGDSDVAMKAP